MFRFLIIWKDDPNIWFKIQGVSYHDSLKDTLSKDPYYFGAAHENYLDDDESVVHLTQEQLSKCISFHKDIFKSIDQYIVFQINFITGVIQQLEEKELV